MSGRWRVIIVPSVIEQLAAISDRRVRRLISERIDGLAENPLQQGKPLLEELAGYRSIRAVGQRYRVIYRVTDDTITVYVVAIGRRHDGSRDDIYALAKRLARRGRLGPPPAEDDAEQQNRE